MSEKIEFLRKFITDNLKYIVPEGGSGCCRDFPKFDLIPRDYLDFAEKELCSNNSFRQINCIGHLKRAIDSQLDTFFYIFNLSKIFNQRNLKIEKKLDFLKEAGVFSSYSLNRLNTIRNRMEHKYEIPKIEDLDVYFDLVTSFIAIIERTISLVNNNYQEYSINNKDNKELGWFSLEYDFEKPSIKFWQNLNSDKKEIIVDLSNPYEFAFYFRVLLLLYLRSSFASDRYINSQINCG